MVAKTLLLICFANICLGRIRPQMRRWRSVKKEEDFKLLQEEDEDSVAYGVLPDVIVSDIQLLTPNTNLWIEDRENVTDLHESIISPLDTDIDQTFDMSRQSHMRLNVNIHDVSFSPVYADVIHDKNDNAFLSGLSGACGTCGAQSITPGCNVPAIEQCVCDNHDDCCITEWDGFCADLAVESCGCVPDADWKFPEFGVPCVENVQTDILFGNVGRFNLGCNPFRAVPEMTLTECQEACYSFGCDGDVCGAIAYDNSTSSCLGFRGQLGVCDPLDLNNADIVDTGNWRSYWMLSAFQAVTDQYCVNPVPEVYDWEFIITRRQFSESPCQVDLMAGDLDACNPFFQACQDSRNLQNGNWSTLTCSIVETQCTEVPPAGTPDRTDMLVCGETLTREAASVDQFVTDMYGFVADRTKMNETVWTCVRSDFEPPELLALAQELGYPDTAVWDGCWGPDVFERSDVVPPGNLAECELSTGGGTNNPDRYRLIGVGVSGIDAISIPDPGQLCYTGDRVYVQLQPSMPAGGFACDVEYQPPSSKTVFSMSYDLELLMDDHPGYTFSSDRFNVFVDDAPSHASGQRQFDFLTVNHELGLELQDTYLLRGSPTSVGTTYEDFGHTFYALKIGEYNLSQVVDIDGNIMTPFVINTDTWSGSNGCCENLTWAIGARQPVPDFIDIPLEADVVSDGVLRNDTDDNGGHVYTITSLENPVINVTIPTDNSIIQSAVPTGVLGINDLKQSASLTNSGSLWTISVSGTMFDCPSFLSVQLYDGITVLKRFDVAVLAVQNIEEHEEKCPFNFTFVIPTEEDPNWGVYYEDDAAYRNYPDLGRFAIEIIDAGGPIAVRPELGRVQFDYSLDVEIEEGTIVAPEEFQNLIMPIFIAFLVSIVLFLVVIIHAFRNRPRVAYTLQPTEKSPKEVAEILSDFRSKTKRMERQMSTSERRSTLFRGTHHGGLVLRDGESHDDAPARDRCRHHMPLFVCVMFARICRIIMLSLTIWYFIFLGINNDDIITLKQVNKYYVASTAKLANMSDFMDVHRTGESFRQEDGFLEEVQLCDSYVESLQIYYEQIRDQVQENHTDAMDAKDIDGKRADLQEQQLASTQATIDDFNAQMEDYLDLIEEYSDEMEDFATKVGDAAEWAVDVIDPEFNRPEEAEITYEDPPEAPKAYEQLPVVNGPGFRLDPNTFIDKLRRPRTDVEAETPFNFSFPEISFVLLLVLVDILWTTKRGIKTAIVGLKMLRGVPVMYDEEAANRNINQQIATCGLKFVEFLRFIRRKIEALIAIIPSVGAIIAVLVLGVIIILELTSVDTLVHVGAYDLLIARLDLKILFINQDIANSAITINQRRIPTYYDTMTSRLNGIIDTNNLFNEQQAQDIALFNQEYCSLLETEYCYEQVPDGDPIKLERCFKIVRTSYSGRSVACDIVGQQFLDTTELEECSISKVLPVLFTDYDREEMRNSLIEESAEYVQALHNLISRTCTLMAWVIGLFFILEIFVMFFGWLFIKWEAIRVNRLVRYKLPIKHMELKLIGENERRIDRQISEFERATTDVGPARARTQYPNAPGRDALGRR